MKNLNASITASILYIVFLFSINRKFAGEFREYLLEN